jgi:hypothetical protein
VPEPAPARRRPGLADKLRAALASGGTEGWIGIVLAIFVVGALIVVASVDGGGGGGGGHGPGGAHGASVEKARELGGLLALHVRREAKYPDEYREDMRRTIASLKAELAGLGYEAAVIEGVNWEVKVRPKGGGAPVFYEAAAGVRSDADFH